MHQMNATDLAVQYVVEPDDRSHDRAKRQGRDEFADKAQAAGVPIFHFSAKRSYAVTEVRQALSGNATSTEKQEVAA